MAYDLSFFQLFPKSFTSSFNLPMPFKWAFCRLIHRVLHRRPHQTPARTIARQPRPATRHRRRSKPARGRQNRPARRSRSRSITVLPKIPVCEAIITRSPINTLCAICTRLSILSPRRSAFRQRAPVDTGVRADLDIIFDRDRYDLRKFYIPARRRAIKRSRRHR